MVSMKAIPEYEKEVNFNWNVTQITADEVTFKLDFETPEEVSIDSEKQHKLEISIHNALAFASSDDSSLNNQEITIVKYIPRQLLYTDNVFVQLMDDAQKATQTAFKGTLIELFTFSFFWQALLHVFLGQIWVL